MSEQSRARYPDSEGFVERDGVRTFYEVYGEGEPTILFLPAWSVCYSRLWKAQIPYFARHYRVLVFDPRGNGRSDKPVDPAAFADEEIIGDALAVMDATHTERVIAIGVSMGGLYGAMLAAIHPDRTDGAVLMAPASQLGGPHPDRVDQAFMDEVETDEGWRGKFNRHYWLRDFPGFADFFASKVINEPHSTKQVEDMAGWIRETTPESLIASATCPGWTVFAEEGARRDPDNPERGAQLECYERIQCPVLVIHGDSDMVIPHHKGVAVAEAIGAPLITLEGTGHAPEARIPVKVNLLIREFVESVHAAEAQQAAAAA
jgi:pimeloyl-ACP methyl ester carboxylesterase